MKEKEIKYKFSGDIISRIDIKYGFISRFNIKTGEYLRSDIINEKGLESGKEAFQASFPHLIDVGIMGNCIHGQSGLCAKAGVGCYQNGPNVKERNMTLDDFKKITDECRNYVDQFALGGRGDPDCHDDFEAILVDCRKKNIVPNFTTSGLMMTEKKALICRKYCGAVAVSWYRSEYTLKAIDLLLKAGVKTNIHYVVSKNTIDEAIERLEKNSFPNGINAIVFLLHKPVGLGKQDEVINPQDEALKIFLNLALKKEHPHKIAFDSCFVPLIAPYLSMEEMSLIDTCEGSRFSMYISPDMKALPCSFDANHKYAYDLKNDTIYNAWNSSQFEKFRAELMTDCFKCPFLNKID